MLKESRRTTPIGNTLRTMTRDQYRYYRTFAKVKWNGHYSGSHRLIYRDDIWKLYEVPKKILSNRGPQFTSKFMEEFTKVLGTKRQLSMVYHPQTDGQTERINQEIGTFL